MDPSAYELTLEQQFQMRLMEASADTMTQEQAQALLVQASRLLMIKDNVINNLLRKTPLDSFGLEA